MRVLKSLGAEYGVSNFIHGFYSVFSRVFLIQEVTKQEYPHDYGTYYILNPKL